MDLSSEEQSNKCNNQAIRNSLRGWKLELWAVLKFQEFLSNEENTMGLTVSAADQSACGALNRYLLIFKRLIFDSRVCAGSPSLAAAPAGPEIRPWLSAKAASIISFSCLTRAPPNVRGRTGFWVGSHLSHVSSTAKVSSSLRITARSITFCSSRTLPGHPYAWNAFRNFLSIVLNFFPALFP